MKRIIVFASGSGSNAENIIKFFNKTKTAKVVQVLCNNKEAKVFERCLKLNVPCSHFTKADFFETDSILNLLKEKADLIILAGFLWRVPSNIVDAFPKRIINIHPALLPKYGGKGMYGMNVHKAVAENKESETGITIHFVNENYDEGAIIYQAKTAVSENDSPEKIAEKIHQLEQSYFPRIIEDVILEINE
jgi:phosphoribosylglycinamide formyltransferase-1